MSDQHTKNRNPKGVQDYTPEQKEEIMTHIFERIESGMSLFKAMEKQGEDGELKSIVSHQTFSRWCTDNVSWSGEYTRVKRVRYDRLAEKTLTDAETEHISTKVVDTEKGTLVTTYDNTERSRLKINAGQWYLSKVDPDRFGSKAGENEGGHVEQPLFNDID